MPPLLMKRGTGSKTRERREKCREGNRSTGKGVGREGRKGSDREGKDRER